MQGSPTPRPAQRILVREPGGLGLSYARHLAPGMVRLYAETKQITHAVRMAAYNAETALARALDGH
jgi:hypothetical protein